jgi:hypothetical protein
MLKYSNVATRQIFQPVRPAPFHSHSYVSKYMTFLVYPVSEIERIQIAQNIFQLVYYSCTHEFL